MLINFRKWISNIFLIRSKGTLISMKVNGKELIKKVLN